MIDNPWIWLSAAAVFMVLEVVLPGYVLLGFAVGAAAVGILLAVGGPLALWLSGSATVTLLAFAVISALAWVLLRRLLAASGQKVRRFDRDINDD